MKYEPRIGVERRPRSHIVLDVESAVIDESGQRQKRRAPWELDK